MQHNSIRGDQWSEQMELKEQREKRERARGVLLYFDSFPKEVQVVLNKYIDVFDTKLCKSINVEPVKLNVQEGSKPYACYSCRPTHAHYRETGMKLVTDLLSQKIVARCGDIRSEWCNPAHFFEKPGRVPLALCLVMDFNGLNNCLIRDQPQVFPTGGNQAAAWPRWVVWVCLNVNGYSGLPTTCSSGNVTTHSWRREWVPC